MTIELKTNPTHPDTITEPQTQPDWIVAPEGPEEDPMIPIPVDPTTPHRNPKTGPVIVPIPWGPRVITRG